MENIIEPSKVISDQYISTEFTMKDGSTVIGRMAEEKAGMLHLMTNPLSADSNVQIKAADVKSRKPHEVSHMPPSLINGLNSDELSDLVEFPNVIEGKFDEEFLDLPVEVLSMVMKSHQRYIPLLHKGNSFSKLDLSSEQIISTNFLLISKHYYK